MNQAVLEEKKKAVENIQEKLKAAKSTVVVEYRGMTVSETTELRRNLRAEKVEMGIYKNSLVDRAATNLGLSDLSKSMTGPNALVFDDDEVAPARILAKFAKKHKNLILKAGVVNGEILDQAAIKELSNLPNKEGMISMFMGCLQSPIRSFARALSAVSESKEKNAPVAAAEVAPAAAN